MSDVSYKTYKSYRIKFGKTGVAKYISHLDLNRLFSRSLARAGIEVMHSEGFNPHPKIVFASAVSLGIESLCEFVDIKITGIETVKNFGDIQKFFPEGILIHRIYEPETKFKDIDRTGYSIFMKPDGAGIDELNKLFEGDVFVEKKPGILINLKDYIYKIFVLQNGNYDWQEYPVLINTVVKTNQAMFLNPENIVKAIKSKYIIEDYFIQKIEIYDKNNATFR